MARVARLHLMPGGFGSEIEVDGQRIPHVQAVHLDAKASCLPSLTLDLLLHEVEIDGVMNVSVPEKTRETLIALGWTPPAAPSLGEPAEIASLPVEVRQLVHAVDRMREDWADASPSGRRDLWTAVHEANDAVWDAPQ